MSIWGYSELDELLIAHPNAQSGFLIDTNILVSATYELDKFNEFSTDFIDKLVDREIPLFCNVNVRSEFLDIHRRILFSEAILDFEKICQKSSLPTELVTSLNSFRSNYERKLKNKPDDAPLRLSDSQIKEFKSIMFSIKGNNVDNLWSELCDKHIGTKVIELWQETEADFGLNFLSLRKDDQEKYLVKNPDWDDVMRLMSNPGLSSSDAMIVNMFSVSKFEVIASSDMDIAFFIKMNPNLNKQCVVPDELKKVLFTV